MIYYMVRASARFRRTSCGAGCYDFEGLVQPGSCVSFRGRLASNWGHGHPGGGRGGFL